MPLPPASVTRIDSALVPSLRLRQVPVEEYVRWTAEFADLAARAADPNPHMSPAAVQALCGTLAAPEDVVILAVTTAEAAPRLVGVWVLGFTRPPWGLGVPVLSAPVLPIYEVLSHPVVDAGCLDAVLRRLLTHLADERRLPGQLRCTSLAIGGDTGAALLRHIPEVGGRLAVFDRWERALFRPEVGANVEGYLRGSMGSSFRRCRSKRRALERAGEVTFSLHRGPAAVDALPRFLRLEASGWKGKNGTAMGSAPRHAAYASAVVDTMSRTDDIAIAELTCDGRPIAMGLLPSSGGTVVFAKTAYDEDDAKYSPGVLLDMEITAALLADPAFRLMDTGMDDSMPADGVIWGERRSMAHAIVALRGAPAGWIATGGLGLRQRMRAARRRYAHAWRG